MKKTLMLILILISVVANAGENAPWVDMMNCPVCKNVSSEDGLMENMTWEHHLTATGLMTVSTVKPAFQSKFVRAKAGMKKMIDKFMSGEEMDLCEYCTSVTSLLKKGVTSEIITTHGADVMLISSTDKDMIEKIHAHGQKTIDFLNPVHTGHEH